MSGNKEMASHIPLVVATLLMACLPWSFSTSLPGLRIRMTQKGLDYANSVALSSLSTKFENLRIPDQSGNSKGLEYTLTGIENRGVTIPSSSMKFDPQHNGLTWTMSGLGLQLHSRHWRVKYKKGWIKLPTSGSVDLNVKRVSLSVTVGLDQAGGRPSSSLSLCQASIGGVDVRFHGGYAVVLNLFKGIIGNKIKGLLQREICNLARDLINNDLNKELEGLKVNVDVGRHLLLDYSLVTAPVVRDNSLELQNKGEINWKSEVEAAPFSPKPIPEPEETSRMMYLWVSDFVANSAIHHAHKHGLLEYTVSDRDFPSDFMSTSCSLLCIGNVVPIVGQSFPNAKVQASVTALQPPSLSISPEGISLEGVARIDLSVESAEGETVGSVVAFDVNVFLTVTGFVFYERLVGEIIDYRIEVESVQSILGSINPMNVNMMLKAALDIGIIPGLNDKMREGLELPITEVLALNNTQIKLLDGSLMIASDITMTSPPTKEQQEEERRQHKQREQQKRLLLLQQHEQRQLKKQEEAAQASTTISPTTSPETQPPTELPTSTEQSIPTEQQTPSTPESSSRHETTRQPQKISTEQPQEITGATATQPPSQSEHNAFCDRVINFCHASSDFCSGP